MSERTVLIVDDSPEDCATFRRYLSRAEERTYRILEASSGRAALEQLRHATPDCILLDFYLPDMDGMEVLAALKGESDTPHCPVVMLTGADSAALAVSAMQQGALDYLIKDIITGETLTRAIENAIEKHRLYRQLEAQREELRESRARYQHLLNSSPVAIFSCIPHDDFRATYVSENVQAILGYGPERFCEPGFWESHIHPEDRERLFADLPQLFSNGSHTHDYRFRLEDGSYIWVYNVLTLVQGADGEVREIVGVLQNISERKEADEKLRLALEAGQSGTFLHDLVTDRVEWSVALERMVGYRPGEFGGTFEDFLRHIHPEDLDAMKALIFDAIARCQEYQFEFRMVRVDGSILWLAGRGKAYARRRPDADTITGIVYDVTAQKTTQERLREREHFLRRIIEVTPGIIHIFDVQEERNVFINRPVTSALGYNPDDIQEMGAEVITALMHPEDRPGFERHRAHVRTLNDTEIADFEFRMRDRAGEWHWFHSRDAVFLRDPAGDVRQIIGTGIEITARKEAEKALKQSEERFRIAENASRSFVYDYDPVTGAEERSEGFTRMLGYTHAELPYGGAMWETLIHPDDLEKVHSITEEAGAGGSPVVSIEYRLRHKNGDWIWVMDEFVVIRSDRGEVQNIIGSIVDISVQKQQQEEIVELNTRLQRAVAESHHRIKNNLQILSAMMEMQSFNAGEMVPRTEWDRLRSHIRTLSSLHDILTLESKVGADGLDTISLKSMLEKLLPMMETAGGRRIVLRLNHDFRVPLKQGSSFILLVNELVSNAHKHGKGDVEVELRGEETLPSETQGGPPPKARLEVRDDGPGFPTDFVPSKAANTGIELIESMARWDLRGDVVYENRVEGGARVVVVFPILETAEAVVNADRIIENADPLPFPSV